MCNTTATATTGITGTTGATVTPSAPTFASSRVRNKSQTGSSRPQFTRALRENCQTKDKLSICREATSGAPTKIKKVDYDKVGMKSKDDTLFENNVEVETFITTVERHCVRFDMAYTFKNFPVLDPVPPSGDHSLRFNPSKTINLFEQWD